MMGFLRLFEFALVVWIPLFFLIYYFKSWNWSVAKIVYGVLGAAVVAALLTAIVITGIVVFLP